MDFCRHNAPGPDLLPLTYILAANTIMTKHPEGAMILFMPLRFCQNEAFCGEALGEKSGVRLVIKPFARCGAPGDWGRACAFRLCLCNIVVVWESEYMDTEART